MAAWQRPPTDILGQVVPIQQFVVQTDHMVVALQHAIAFPEGCILALHVAARRGSLDESAWERLAGSNLGGYPEVELIEGDLKLGVRFPDGSRATTVEHPFRGWAHPTDRPDPPMLIETSGGSGRSDQSYDSDRQLWLWPLPPPGPFEFVIEWQHMGIDMTSVALDGSAIVRAAEQARPYWPATG